MKKQHFNQSLLVLIICLLTISAKAQLSVTPAGVPPVTPVNLIKQVFLGDGVEVLNVNFQGDNAAIGRFSGGQNIIGIDQGIIMTTGSAALAATFPNTNAGAGLNNNGTTDADLASISGFNINDAAIYTITFIPTADTLRFKYVFASEEYPDYVCSINDVFGFFISGPGITGPYSNMSSNIALIPNTTTPVGVNTINGGVSAGGAAGCLLNNTAFYVDNNAPNAPLPFEYDGFTTVLTATAIVNPCDTYQIKLAIGDAVDDILDSGVFLAANSFGTSGLTVRANTPNFTSTIAEGCKDAEVVFRLDQPADGNMNLNYTVGGNAIPGVDYVPIPLTGVIPTGQDSFTITIHPILDNISEGTDTIAFYVNTTACTNDTIYVYIEDTKILPPNNISDTTICYNNTVRFDATVPLVISNGVSFSNNNNFTITHLISTNSPVTVANLPLDYYLAGAIDSVCINISHPKDQDLDIFLRAPTGEFLELSTDNGGFNANYTQTCFVIDTSAMSIEAGTAPFTGSFEPEGDWSDLDGATMNGDWFLTIIDDFAGNNGTLLDWTIHFAPIYNITYDWTPINNISCDNCPIANVFPDSTTQYNILATDTYGCVSQDSAVITVIEQLEMPQGNCTFSDVSSIIFGWNTVPNASNYQINIDNAGWWTLSNTTTNYTVSNLSQGQTVEFQIRAMDGICPASEIDTVICSTVVCTLVENINTITNVGCHNQADGTAFLSVTNPIGNYSFNLNNSVVQNSNFFNNLDTGNYTVIVTDSVNCKDTVNFSISQPMPFIIDSITSTPLSCNGDGSGTATVFPSSGTPNYTYSWNTTPVQTTQTATNLQAATYSITVTDANNCTAFNNITLTEPAALTAITTTENVSCNGLSDGKAVSAATGGTLPYAYQWNTTPIQTSDTATNLAAGNYTFTVTDANNCTFSNTITITEPTALSISMASTPASCFYSSDGTGTASLTGGTSPYTYLWDTATIALTVPTNTTLNVGKHYVTVIDAGNCMIVDSVIVTGPPAIIPTVIENPATCFGVYDGSVGVSATGGIGAFTYTWSTVPTVTGTTVNNLFNGQYFVTVTDATGCSVIDTALIAGPVILSATKDSVPVTCFGGADGAVFSEPSGGTGAGTYTYTWNNNPALNTASLTNITAGTYSVYIADANGCARIDSMIVNTPDTFLTNFTMIPVSCNDFSDGAIMTAPSGGTAGYLINWFNNSPNNSVSGLIAGAYTITVTDANNCVLLDTIEVLQPDVLALSTDTLAVSCFGLNDGKAWVTATGGNIPYNYQWNNSTILTDTLNNQPTGFYKVVVSDFKNCQDSITAFIRQPDTLTVMLNEIPVSCFGGNNGQAIATVTGGTIGYNYNWSVPQSTDTISNLTIGNYQLTVSDTNNCLATANITVTEPTILAATLSQTPTSCYQGNNGTATAVVTGGTSDAAGNYTYQWNTNPIQTTAAAINLTALSTYTVTVTDANNCTFVDSIMIGQPTELLATTAFTPVICNGETNGMATVLSTGGTPFYTYQWNTTPMQTASSATGLAAGQYTVTTTDANNCNRIDTVNVTQPTDILVDLDSINVRCFGFNDGKAWVTVTGGVAPYIYSWNAGTTPNTDTLSSATAGNYLMFVIDANNCLDSASVNITQPDSVTVQFTTDSTTCNKGNDGSTLAAVTGGAGSYTYQWSNTALDTNFNNNLTAGFYTLSVTDTNNCTTIDTVSIQEPEPVLLTFSMRPPTCYNGGDGWAAANISGGNAPYSLFWVDSSQSQDTIFNRIGGKYYTAIATDAYGCVKTDSVFVPNPDTLIIELITTDEACQSGGNGTITANAQGGYAPYSYAWDAASGSQTASIATNLSTGNYTVTITDNLGCQVSKSGFVGLSSGISVTITPTNVLCKGGATGSATAAAQGGSGAFQYQWSDNQNTQTAINLTAGDYTVTVTDTIGCEEIATITIIEPKDFLDIAIDSIKDVNCFGDRDGYLRIRGIGGIPTYQYSLNSGTFGAARAWTGLIPANYRIAVRDNNGCIFEEVIPIIEPLLLTVDLGEDVFMTERDTFTATPIIINGIEPFSYQWTPADSSVMTCTACPNPLWTGLFNTTYYTLTVTDSMGCITEDDLLITLLKDQKVYVPTAFSPNNNFTNDRLFIQGDDRVQVNYFRVYDRWGELVFESRDHAVNDPDVGWDGYFKGQPMDIGTFGWVAEVVFLDGKVEVFKGSFVLVR